MHISDQIADFLISEGWTEISPRGEFKKRISNYSQSGSISSGARVVTLVMNETGRWLSRVDGWGGVEVDVDLRDVDGPKDAVEKVIK